jgi:hypothetical protein
MEPAAMLKAAKVFGEAPLADFKNRKELEAWLRTQLYKFLFDLTDGGNWLVDVHASS